MTDSTVFELSECVDISRLESLYADLENLSNQDKAVCIDAHKVKQIDTSVFQLLYSLQKALSERGASFSIVKASEAFLENATLIGMGSVLSIEAGL